MKDILTVAQLIKVLQEFPQDAVVLEENTSGLRGLRQEDISTFASSKSVLYLDDEEEPVSGPAVVFGAWD